jgi:hypothetical protein
MKAWVREMDKKPGHKPAFKGKDENAKRQRHGGMVGKQKRNDRGNKDYSWYTPADQVCKKLQT